VVDLNHIKEHLEVVLVVSIAIITNIDRCWFVRHDYRDVLGKEHIILLFMLQLLLLLLLQQKRIQYTKIRIAFLPFSLANH